jgi:hypothetical protein
MSTCTKCNQHTYAPNESGECMMCDPEESIDWQSRAIAAEARVEELTQERDNVRFKLASLSSKLGCGLGDESRSTASYVGAIDYGIELHDRAQSIWREKLQARIAELEDAAELARKIGEAWKARKDAAAKRDPADCDSDEPDDNGTWKTYGAACRLVTTLLDQAAALTGKEST